MPKSNASSIPGVDVMTDTLEFVKNMWGGMKIPGMVMPTLSVDDINKQIADLKAVESWLTLNMNMLRGTIQALEVQSATISTLKSMGESMSAMVKPNGGASPSSSSSSFMSTATPSAVTGVGKAEETAATGDGSSSSKAGFGSSFSFAPPTAEKPPAPKSESEPEPELGSQPKAPPQPAAQAIGLAAAPFANPAAWWNMLQEQFRHAVNTAVAQEPVPEPEPAVEKSKTRVKEAPASSSASKAAKPKSKKNSARSASDSRSASAKTSSAGKRKTARKS